MAKCRASKKFFNLKVQCDQAVLQPKPSPCDLLSVDATAAKPCLSIFQGRACSQDLFLSLWLCMRVLSRVWLSATPWTVAGQAPLPMEFSRQEYWSGLPFPSPGDLPASLASSALADSSPLFHLGSPSSWLVFVCFHAHFLLVTPLM